MIEQQILFYLHLSLLQAPVFSGNDGENVFNMQKVILTGTICLLMMIDAANLMLSCISDF